MVRTIYVKGLLALATGLVLLAALPARAADSEMVVITLSNATGAALGDAASLTLTIADDEAPPTPPTPGPSATPGNTIFLPLVWR